jgi:hypothetical protein
MKTETELTPNNITEADRGGVFFERKRRKKAHRMVGQSVTQKCRRAQKNKTPLQRGFEDTRAFKNQAAVNQ